MSMDEMRAKIKAGIEPVPEGHVGMPERMGWLSEQTSGVQG